MRAKPFVTVCFACSVGLLCACDGDAPQGREPAQTSAQTTAHAVDAAAADASDGAAVYERHCASCHEAGREGAPALDHVPSWASRSPEWSAVLKQHAVAGFLSMPPAGGGDLSEAEVGAAVDFMLSRIRPPSVLAEGAAEGRLVYQASCARCHDTGVDGAPVIGDNDAWAARSYNWHTVLEQHASEGFLGMPARGGELQLFHEDVARAVAFITAWSRRP